MATCKDHNEGYDAVLRFVDERTNDEEDDDEDEDDGEEEGHPDGTM